MELQSPTTLVLCGKSTVENELARCLKSNNRLKLPDGSPLNVVLNSEMECRDSAENDGKFCVTSYMDSLATSRFGRLLVYSPKLASTHDVVSHNFEELPVGGVCVADVQLKGRGRSKKCLAITKGVPYVFIHNTDGGWPSCPIGAGMPLLNVRIKWPNDLYLDGAKVGGILCTSVYKSKKFNVSAGIGLNVDNQKPTTCLNSVLQRLTPFTHRLQLEDIIAAFFNKFETFYDIFINQGFRTLEELYYKTWLHSGQRVIVQEQNEKREPISELVIIQVIG
ncbi:biotin--protein ligase-like [Dorcoceras hygrometricum]|uniref:Biotin--protein ligase-like n=1 Tax=Dorcoceras hygrometricum TaxID=472368 RepID=A0A2Z7B4X0_9LAMI|nr:biotin--protein ligase-like [Dorcoceras hygrometricum]